MLGAMIRRTTASPSRLRVTAGVSLALVAGLTLAACGSSSKGSDDSSGDKPAAAQPTAGGTQLKTVWPLTGLPVTGQAPNHPVMIVKIDNTSASAPQLGLGKADMVVQELVEGGITRLAAMFHSQLPTKVGPVRSARASDIGVVKPTHAVLVASGMAPDTVRRLDQAHVRYYTMGAPGVSRDANDPQHDFLHSVFVNLPKLAKSLKTTPTMPASYLPWGAEADFAGVTPARNVDVRFSQGSSSNFRYLPASKKYANTNTYAAKGDRFMADSVLVLRVREGDAGYRDPAGNRVPETLFFGTGNMVLFHHGQALRGTWSKPKRESPLVLRTAAGPIKVPAGHVWLELLPVEGAGGHVTFTP